MGTQNVTLDVATTIAVLTLSGGTLNLTGDLNVTGMMNWTGGTLTNSGAVIIAPSATLSMGPDAVLLTIDGGTLVNEGTATWSAGTLKMLDGGVLSNAVGGVFQVAFDAGSANFGGATSTIANAGQFNKTAGTGTASLAFPLINTGSVQSQSGTLSFTDGGTNSGNFSALAEATVSLSGASHNLVNGTSVSGPGNFEVNGGSVNFSGACAVTNGQISIAAGTLNLSCTGPVSPANLSLSGGTLGGTSQVRVSNAMDWTGGTITGSGAVIVAPSATLNMGPGAVLLTIDGGTLVNEGTATWSAGTLKMLDGGVLSNAVGGVFQVAFDAGSANFGGATPTIANAGLFRKTAGTGTASLAVAFQNSGTLDVQSGTLSLTSTHNLAGGRLNFGLAGPATYGQLTLAGAAGLTGSVSANLIGYYWPAVGTTFNVLNYGSATGLFSSTSLPAFLSWETNYSSTIFSLNVLARQTNFAPANLSISQVAPGQIEISWPGDHTGWRLQAHTNSFSQIGEINWADISGATLTNQVVMPASAAPGAAFFRLALP